MLIVNTIKAFMIVFPINLYNLIITNLKFATR